eukprot:3362807-Amphidinium_carterae.1
MHEIKQRCESLHDTFPQDRSHCLKPIAANVLKVQRTYCKVEIVRGFPMVIKKNFRSVQVLCMRESGIATVQLYWALFVWCCRTDHSIQNILCKLFTVVNTKAFGLACLHASYLWFRVSRKRIRMLQAAFPLGACQQCSLCQAPSYAPDCSYEMWCGCTHLSMVRHSPSCGPTIRAIVRKGPALRGVWAYHRLVGTPPVIWLDLSQLVVDPSRARQLGRLSCWDVSPMWDS